MDVLWAGTPMVTLPGLFYTHIIITACMIIVGGSVAECLACWIQAQKGSGSNRSRDAVGVTVLGKLFTPTVPLFTKQQNW